MTLADYNTECATRDKLIVRAMTIFDTGSSDSSDIARAVKSIEIIYRPDILKEFTEFYPKLNRKIESLVDENPLSDSLLYLTRGFQIIGDNSMYEDIYDRNADSVVSDRTLESFDDKVLEQFYEEL